jgi:hypothetical protein
MKIFRLIALRRPIDAVPENPQAPARWTAEHRLGRQIDVFSIDQALESIELDVRKNLPLQFVRDSATHLNDRGADASDLGHYGITTICPTLAPVPAILAWMLAS